MRVGFYLGETSVEKGGVGPYANRLASLLGSHHFDSGIEVRVMYGPAAQPPTGVPPERIVRVRRSRGLGRLVHSIRQRAQAAVEAACKKRDSLDRWTPVRGGPVRQAVRRSGIDLLHVPVQCPPDYNPGVPYVVTMHDLQELHCPQFFSAEERRYRAIEFLRSIRNAAAVVVSFQHVKDDLVRFFACDPGRVAVLPLPVAQSTFDRASTPDPQQMEERYGDAGGFFLYPAQTWEHKNHLRLIDAFERVARNADRPLRLVCTGRQNPAYFPAIHRRLQDSPLRDSIYFPGLVSDSHLGWLYRNCLAVVIPTLYEAGSFPLVEAMQTDAPVVCARTTSLPDTLGDDRFLFNPNDIDAITGAMQRMVIDRGFREASRENGRRRIEELERFDLAGAYEAFWLGLRDRLRV